MSLASIVQKLWKLVFENRNRFYFEAVWGTIFILIFTTYLMDSSKDLQFYCSTYNNIQENWRSKNFLDPSSISLFNKLIQSVFSRVDPILSQVWHGLNATSQRNKYFHIILWKFLKHERDFERICCFAGEIRRNMSISNINRWT